MTKAVKLAIKIEGEKDIDNIELDMLSHNLHDEIKRIDVEFVRSAGYATLPDHSKGDPFTIGSLVIAVLPTLLPSVILLIQSWLLRQQNQNIKVKLGNNEIEVPRDLPQEEIQKNNRSIEVERP